MDAKMLRELRCRIKQDGLVAAITTHGAVEEVVRALSLLASVEGASEEIVRELQLRARGQRGEVANSMKKAAARIIALRAELASVKAERDAFENVQLPCNVVVNSTVINKGCRVKTALTAIRQQIKYAQPDVAPDRAAHPKDAPTRDELLRMAVAARDNDTRTEEQIIADGVAFVLDTRVGGP